jgi:hypothetical protein
VRRAENRKERRAEAKRKGECKERKREETIGGVFVEHRPSHLLIFLLYLSLFLSAKKKFFFRIHCSSKSKKACSEQSQQVVKNKKESKSRKLVLVTPRNAATGRKNRFKTFETPHQHTTEKKTGPLQRVVL